MDANKFKELVYQTVGEASMCWSELPGGVFDSTKAKELADRLIREHEAELDFLANELGGSEW